MDDDQQNEGNGLVAWILGIAVTIAIAVSLIIGIVGALGGGGKPAATTAAAPAAAPAAPADAPASAPIAGPVKFYFDTGKAEPAADAADAAKPIIDALSAHADAKIFVSGFHDATGNAEQNAVLARDRAFAIRDLLQKAGVAEDRIVLRKPQQMMGGADEREARRVELTVEKG